SELQKALRGQLPDGRFQAITARRSSMMKAVKVKNNRTTERRLRLALVRSGVRGWKLRVRNLRGSPDFVFDARRLAIIIDGCFSNGCETCVHFPRTNAGFWKTKITRNR